MVSSSRACCQLRVVLSVFACAACSADGQTRGKPQRDPEQQGGDEGRGVHQLDAPRMPALSGG